MKRFYLFYIKYLLRLYNFLYNEITRIAVKLNDDIHPKHRIMNYHKFFLDNIKKSSRILEIGCGIGYLSYDLAKKAQKIVAIDINKKYIDIAKKKFHKNNIIYIIGDATKYNFKEVFDYIILSNILEHIKDRQNFLKKIKCLGKIILIRVPMINRSWLTLYMRELGIDYRLTKEHYIEYTLESFINEIESVGFKVKSYSIQFGELWSVIES